MNHSIFTGFKAIQACGESFYRVYNEAGRVVMTANVGATDEETGFIPVSPIWKDGAALGSPDFNAMIEAVRQRVIEGPLTA